MPLTKRQWSGAVLCGGASTRMGRDKALIGNPPWADRVATALAESRCDPVILVGGSDGVRELSWEFVRDEHPGTGPLAAIVTAVNHRDARALVVAACDMPNVRTVDVRALIDAVDAGADSATYSIGAVPQWSLLALSADACAAAVDGFASGIASIHGVFSDRAKLLEPLDRATIADIDEPGR